MQDFVHLHVHTQYSILDGQASVAKLVDKAIKNGMRGMAITDHGNMMAIKEYFNYVRKLKSNASKLQRSLKEKKAQIENGSYKPASNPKETPMGNNLSREMLVAECDKEINAQQRILDFKPIFGCEMYVARRGLQVKETKIDSSGWHLIVLAKNEKGYHNLIKLVSKAWTDGFYMRPRTDKKELEKYREGLIVSSACLGGEIPQKIIGQKIEEAEEAVAWFKKTFGDDYYLELQRHEVTNPNVRANRSVYPLQERVNKVILDIAQKYNVKVICTNDVHFVDEENAEAHDRLICLSTGKDLDDPKRMLYTKQEWFKTREEMNQIFADHTEALANTCEVCDKVEEYSIDHPPIMPNFAIPESFGTEEEYRKKYSGPELIKEFTCDEHGNTVLTEEEARKKIEQLGGVDKLYRLKLEADYLASLTYRGAEQRYGSPLSTEVDERLKYELHIMKTMGFPGYFLIVQDYIAAARNELNVSVGPGRGSAAGSAVAYCLGITQIDPIQYDLLFERFLNPDRISLPDIDVDFDDDGRGRVLQWVTQKYGEEKVAHIITYGTMAAKLAIKDVARVQKLPLDESNRLCKLIPDRLPEDENGRTPKVNLTNVIKAVPELQEAEASTNKVLADTIRYAKMLEGNVRNTGVHACGTIICRDDVSDWVPISTAEDKETGEKLRCTQYEGSVIEETGLIKMDFLGLKTLSIIREAVENIKQSLRMQLDIDKIDINDPATFQLYCDGKTIGTFQFESPGMQKNLRELQPSSLEDLIAMNALYRPGPMAYIPSFIARKHGQEEIKYDLPCMEKYLKETYGITVYQEQVMLLSREIAGFTRGESDALRKAMGKKLIEKLNAMYPKFISGGKANGYDEKILEKIWNDWKAFASYAFNKSHATCYSWVSYQTAYLKANYPAQYMAGAMSRNLDKIVEITKLMDECKAMGIETLGPDLNESNLKFSVNHSGNIRFGLAAIKGVGESAVEAILKERREHGPFVSLFDFFQRVNLTACNKKNIESLVLSGAFDCFSDICREQYFAPSGKEETFLEALVKYGNRYQADAQTSQQSLFGGDDVVAVATPEVPQNYDTWNDLDRLNKERDLIGIYLSGHPLDRYRAVLEHVCNVHFNQLEDLESLKDQKVILGGIVTVVREGHTKKGAPYGIIKMEDFQGGGQISLFGQDWVTWRNYMQVGNTLYITAMVRPLRWDETRLELHVENIEFLEEVENRVIKSFTIQVHVESLDEQVIDDLTNLLEKNRGNTSIYFYLIDPEGKTSVSMKSTRYKVAVQPELISYIDSHPALGYNIN